MTGSVHLHLSTASMASTTSLVERSAAFSSMLGAHLEVSIARVEARVSSHWAGEHFAPVVLDADVDSRSKAIRLATAARTASERLSLSLALNEYALSHCTVDRRAAIIARCHDFTMMGLAGGDSDGRRAIEDLVFASGRPVMILPDGVVAPLTLGRVTIAWDHSEAAARALALGLPLIREARRVDVVTVDAGQRFASGDPAAAAAAYLARHGIKAAPRTVQAQGRKVGRVLMETAEAAGSSLLVAGAYNTPRTRELLFGGVTRSLLERPRVPLLVAN